LENDAAESDSYIEWVHCVTLQVQLREQTGRWRQP